MTDTPSVSPRDSHVLDESYTRMHTKGPEFEGWLSNHGPMAADALIRLGCGGEVEGWVDGYAPRLDEAPAPRWDIEEAEWREVVGDPSRLGDWCALFDRQLREEPWRDVLIRWWPRLLDGAVASAAHGLTRTGHAVRALLELPTAPRGAELAQALGYWAARHQPLPAHPSPHGGADPATALDAVSVISTSGGIRTASETSRSEQRTVTPEQVTRRAVATGDAHAIKFVEVAQESDPRGNSYALAAGARASHLIAPVDDDV